MPITQGIAGHVASTGKAYNKYHTYQAKSRLLFIKCNLFLMRLSEYLMSPFE